MRVKIECDIEEIELENERGELIPSVSLTCSRCNHVVESFGQHSGSIKRCLATMRDECEEVQGTQFNYYWCQYP